MNTSLIILDKETIETLKFSELATEYNKYATELGIKNIKKFRDKATGQARLLDIQIDYIEALPEDCGREFAMSNKGFVEIQVKVEEPKVEEPKKRQTRFDLCKKLDYVLPEGTDPQDYKPGTIESSIMSAIRS